MWETFFSGVFQAVYVHGIDHNHSDFLHCGPPAESKRLNLICAQETPIKE
jgi:hypothetical protein